MDRKSFVLYTESREIIDKLNIEQRGMLLTALFDHIQGYDVQPLDPLTDIVFTTIRNYMDKDFKKYESRCEKNRENANNRWKKEQSENMQSHTNKCERMQSHTNGQSRIDSHYDNDSYSESDSYSDSEDIKGDTSRVKKKSPRRFEPPTVEDVRQYVQSKGYSVDPESFVDYYTARGWELSKGRKVKDWQACVRTWNGNSKSWNQEKQKKTGVTISEEQRSEYSTFDDLFGNDENDE